LLYTMNCLYSPAASTAAIISMLRPDASLGGAPSSLGAAAAASGATSAARHSGHWSPVYRSTTTTACAGEANAGRVSRQ